MEMILKAENQQTQRDLVTCEASASRDTNKMESCATLKEVLKQAQVSWSTADAESRFLKLERNDLDAKVKSLRSELDIATNVRPTANVAQLARPLYRLGCLVYRQNS